MNFYSFKININEKTKENKRLKNEKRRKKLNTKYYKFFSTIKNKYDNYTSEELRLAKIELENQFDYDKRSGERFSSIMTMSAILVAIISIGFTLITYDPSTTNEIRTPDEKITVFGDQNIDDFFADDTVTTKARSILIEPNPDKINKELAMKALQLINFISFILVIAALNNICRSSPTKSWKVMIEIEMINNLIQRKKTMVQPILEIDTEVLSCIRCCRCNNVGVSHCRNKLPSSSKFCRSNLDY